MSRNLKIIAAACGALFALTASQCFAGKSADTLVWAPDRDVDVALPYYNNVREMVIMSQLTWDSLIYRDTRTFEYKPQLATSWKWVDNVTIDGSVLLIIRHVLETLRKVHGRKPEDLR